MLIRYRRFAPSISYIDIQGVRHRRSPTFNIESHRYVNNRVTDIEVSWLQYRTNTLRLVDIVYDIEGHTDIRYRRSCHTYRVRYRIRYSTQPISFTAEQKLRLPRRYHVCSEKSQRHVPWIPAESCTLFYARFHSSARSRRLWCCRIVTGFLTCPDIGTFVRISVYPDIIPDISFPWWCRTAAADASALKRWTFGDQGREDQKKAQF
jgi:hypothetical protein